MANITFKYCALQYLNLWISVDKKCWEELNGDHEDRKLESLKRAAFAYRVARNLPEMFDVEKGLPRYKPVLDVIGEQKEENFKDQKLIPAIIKVRNDIAAFYGKKDVLSLTTKFLWLKFRSR